MILIIAAAIGVSLLVGYVISENRNRQDWLISMQSTMKPQDDGWAEITCMACGHIFLCWDEDEEYLCTKCGVDYKHYSRLMK